MDPHTTHAPDPVRDVDPAHQQQLDTTAQKPTHIGTGVPTTPPAGPLRIASLPLNSSRRTRLPALVMNRRSASGICAASRRQ